MPFRILVVDDEASIREGLVAILEVEGHEVVAAPTLAAGLRLAEQMLPDLVLLDRRLPDGEGVESIEAFRRAADGASVVIVTGHGEVETVVRAIKRGATNFLLKPVDPDDLLRTVALEAEEARGRKEHVRARKSTRRGIESIIGESPGIRAFRASLLQVAKSDANVLLLGESGTGKGLAAEALHSSSIRADRPFVELNCAGLQASLLESELFGHEKGAFTDARERKIGLMEASDRGTLFLDEIADTDLAVQTKLLKVIEQKKFRRLGAVGEIPVDFRLVAATNRDLEDEVRKGRFREDLFYRLGVVILRLPPLRERRDDIPLLASAMLRELQRRVPNGQKSLDSDAVEALCAHSWPGNIRELHNVIERGIILSTGPAIELTSLPPEISKLRSTVASSEAGDGASHTRMAPLEEIVDEHVGRVFRATGQNVKRSGEILGVSRSALYPRLRRLGLLDDR